MSIHNKKKIKGAVQVSKKTTSQPDMMLNKVKKNEWAWLYQGQCHAQFYQKKIVAVTR